VFPGLQINKIYWLEIIKTAESKILDTGKQISHIKHRKFCPSNQLFINNESKLTRAPLLGKWPTEEKYKYNKPGKTLCCRLPLYSLHLRPV
jgi:hypothetical protein